MSPQLNRAAGAELAAGVLVGLVAFEVIGALVNDLIAPLIAVFMGDSRFELNAFVIEASEFRYGDLLEALFIAAIASVVVLVLLGVRAKRYWAKPTPNNERECPNCIFVISAKASRCPYCTSQLNTSR